MPAEPNSFVGRERELAELRELVSATRALTMCGVGGIGKTRLAVRVLTAVADEFPDGAWLVELADLRQPDLVVSRVASVIGVSEEPGRPLLDTLADALRPRRLLLVLDNCEHLIDACALVCQRLLASSPGLHIITTSREPLRVAAETVWRVPPLSLPPAGQLAGPGEALRYEAIRLFADRAAAVQPGFAVGPANAAAAARLCRALDGIPLAIELAAARAGTLSLEQISERLSDRFGLLTTGNRAGSPRQRTLRATIDWSHDLLAAPEQMLLRRLSVFAGWSLEMAEQVCADDDIPAAGMLDLIAALVDKSLVALEPEALGQARYRLLDTIGAYAAARLADAGESVAFHHRLRDYTVAVAERNMEIGMAQAPASWPERVDFFRRFDVEGGNLTRVLSRCLAEGDAETGLRLCTAIRPCWLVRGTFTEGGEWLDAFLAIAGPGVPAGVRGAALVGRAQLALSSDRAAAEAWATAGLELCRSAGDGFWTASGLSLLSEIAVKAGRMGEAESYAAQALAVARAAGDGWNEGYALGIQAGVAGLQGRLREAEESGQASIRIMRRIDHQWGTARALLGLGDLARLRGDPGEAHHRYLDALAILREIDDRPQIARCLAGLAGVALDLGSTGLARQRLAESLRLSHATGSRIGVARGLAAFAALTIAENLPELAVQLTAAATAVREAAGLPALPGARVERYLAPARPLGEPAVARLWASGLDMTSDAAVALALDGAAGAGATSGGRPSAEAAPSVLTPREREVARLIAGGRSNRDIADELVISPATAARHVANILGKLGFSSRTQIAVWAAGGPLGRADPGQRVRRV